MWETEWKTSVGADFWQAVGEVTGRKRAADVGCIRLKVRMNWDY